MNGKNFRLKNFVKTNIFFLKNDSILLDKNFKTKERSKSLS